MAITLIHCPNCKFAMSADDSSDAQLTCPHCGKQFIYSETQEKPNVSQEAGKAAPSTMEEYLHQAREALQNQEYLLCLDAANAALKLNKGNADALFYQQAASAFAAAGIHASGMRTALDRADAAMEANDFSDMQKAEHFREYLSVICQFLRLKCVQAKERLSNEYCTEEDISDMRADFASLLELCINSAGYLPTSLLEACPEAEHSILDLIEEGNTLITLLKDHYKYYDFPSASYLSSYASSAVKTACNEGANQLKKLKETLPSLISKQEEIRRKQDASKLSVRSYWEAHSEEQAFLQTYLRKNHICRLISLISSVLLFLGIVIGWGIGLKALVKAGIGQGLYYLCIFGLMVIMVAYWIAFSLIYRKFDFKNHATAAKRYLSSPIGKEQAIEAFIEERRKKHIFQRSSKALRKRFTKKLLLTSGVIAASAVAICLILVYLAIPAINLGKGKKAIESGDTLSAITYLDRAGNYSNAKELLCEQLDIYRQRAISYDGRAGAYNNVLAVRDASGDIYYMNFSSTAYPDVAITNAESFLLTQNYIVALRSDGYLSYSQYTTAANAAAPDVSEWSEIVAIGKMNNTIIGYQQDGTLVYNSASLDAETLARLNGDNIVGIYDKFGDIAVRADGTASLPAATNYSYPDKVQEVFDRIAKWQNLAVIKGDITNHIVGLTKDGRVYAVSGWFDSSFGELNVSSWRNVVDIASGESHTVGLLANGTVVATGSNSYGQCDVSDWKDIVAIEAGSNFTMGIASDGTVYITGHGSTTYVPRGMSEICRLAEEVETDEDITSDAEGDITSSEISSSVEN